MAQAKPPRTTRRLIYLSIYVALTAVFGLAFYDSYLRHIGCFNGRGRCFAEDNIV